MARIGGANSYRNVTRKAKLRIVADGVAGSDISSGEVISLIFYADRHIEEADASDRSQIYRMLARGSRGRGPVAVPPAALKALRRIHDLH